MATIKPFRGIRYNPALIPDLSTVVAQPYDKVSDELQEAYYGLGPYNVVRIDRGKELPGDVPDRLDGPNVYTRAHAYYTHWLTHGVLIREPQPALYVLRQTFQVGGETYVRKGLIAAFELSDFSEGIVRPHEHTYSGPKIDRLRLLRTNRVYFGQVFMLYPDPRNRVNAILDQTIAGQRHTVDVVELFEQDVRQQMWVVTDMDAILAVQAEFLPKRNLIIADGHHRYETGLNFRQEMRLQYPDAPPEAAFNFILVTLVSMNDPGLIILPTHREIFDYPGVTPTQILERAAIHFEIIPALNMQDCFTTMQAHTDQHAFGFYTGNQYYVLVLKDADIVNRLITENYSDAWKNLDVTILHKIVLEHLVGLPAEAGDQTTHIRYHRAAQAAINSIDAGKGNCVFFLNPARMDQVQALAERGEKMPQKSTDFYPKVISGLVMMSVEPTERIE